MLTKSARRIQHPPKGFPEYTGDSQRAADQAVKSGIEWIDYNAIWDADGVCANTHYDLALRHGFIDPKGLLHADSRISHLHQADWMRLHTKRGHPPYTIRPMRRRIRYAISVGCGVEVDMKNMPEHRALVDLVLGFDLTHINFKTMATLESPVVGTPWERLKRAKVSTDCVTIILCHRPLITIPQSYVRYIDHYRGFKPRVGS